MKTSKYFIAFLFLKKFIDNFLKNKQIQQNQNLKTKN